MHRMNTQKASFLVVDDEELNRELLTKNLEAEGHIITSCKTGNEALNLLETEKYDVILLDLMLPDVNGITVLEKIRNNSNHDQTHVMMVSASDDRETVLKCIEMGATDYIAKPYSMLIVNSRINRCLKKSYSKSIHEETYHNNKINSARILLVDDQELNRDVLAHRLKKSGFEITCVKTGQEALDILEKESFDLMLLDIMMPDLSGIEVLKIIRESEKFKDMPVMMVTAMDDMTTINECMQAGANDYILKPLNTRLFKIRMATCLGV